MEDDFEYRVLKTIAAAHQRHHELELLHYQLGTLSREDFDRALDENWAKLKKDLAELPRKGEHHEDHP